MKRNWVLSKSGKEGLGWWNLESKRWQLTLLSNPKGTIKRWLMLRHVTMFTLAWNALDLGTYWIEIFDKTSRYFMKFRNSKFDASPQSGWPTGMSLSQWNPISCKRVSPLLSSSSTLFWVLLQISFRQLDLPHIFVQNLFWISNSKRVFSLHLFWVLL